MGLQDKQTNKPNNQTKKTVAGPEPHSGWTLERRSQGRMLKPTERRKVFFTQEDSNSPVTAIRNQNFSPSKLHPLPPAHCPLLRSSQVMLLSYLLLLHLPIEPFNSLWGQPAFEHSGADMPSCGAFNIGAELTKCAGLPRAELSGKQRRTLLIRLSVCPCRQGGEVQKPQ